MNQYNHTDVNISSEEENIINPTVFKIKHSDIPKGVTQCKSHKWRVRNESEIECPVCGTVNIVNNPKEYVS